MYLWVVGALAFGCADPKVCGPCDAAEGLVWCTDCSDIDTCTSTIEEEESGEVVFECEAEAGESCIADQLLSTCPDS